jgi:hypothetical protein
MRKVQISLWINGICAIKSQFLSFDEADARLKSWINVFGKNAHMEVQEAVALG